MKHYIFNIEISYLECENLYSSSIKSVVVAALSGERVQIPSTSLRPFIEPTGIKGRFCLSVSKQNKIQSFTRNDA
ncbi:MAG: hypothetical protein ACI97K_001593 [Glaciecola sp.]|jgi:hypothetical protein